MNARTTQLMLVALFCLSPTLQAQRPAVAQISLSPTLPVQRPAVAQISLSPTLPVQRPAVAQISAQAAPETAFDFLVGRWTLSGTPRVSAIAAQFHGVPKLTGAWQGTRKVNSRLIEDAVRVTDASNRVYLVRSFSREFDATTGAWVVVELARPHERWTLSRPRSDSIVLVGKVRRGNEDVMVRGVFSAIRATSYRYSEERSDNGGESWDKPHITLIAVRADAAISRQ